MKSIKKTNNIFRVALPVFLVLCAGVLCGFSLSDSGQQIIQDAYGRTMSAFKTGSTKQVAINGIGSKTLTYKETENLRDTPAISRSDSYGTYDVYVDSNDNEYVYLSNSGLLCGYKETDSVKSAEKVYAGQNVTQTQAKEIADQYISTVMGNDSQKYTYKDTELSSLNIYYVNYCFYLNGIKTDDECVVWVYADSGEVAAFHAFNRGRYDGYTNRNLSTSASKARLEEQIPLVKSADYKIFDQYITKTDDGKLVMHYDIVHKENDISKTRTFEAPLE